ncbi:MAG TPA: ATP-binding cassette domain-containing protein, partial [Terricaulis sp.]|nr:ATP-binding cassette domain-containing protein [Terricaulis sp.]
MTRPSHFDTDLFDRGVFVRLSGVDAGYGDSAILRGVDFEARKGEVALVSGPEAAGKSTLIHLLRLALAPRAGRAVILGADAARAGPRGRARVKRRVGYVAENPVFVEQWSAFENIGLPLKMRGIRARDYTQDVRELVDFVGLAEGATDLAVE